MSGCLRQNQVQVGAPPHPVSSGTQSLDWVAEGGGGGSCLSGETGSIMTLPSPPPLKPQYSPPFLQGLPQPSLTPLTARPQGQGPAPLTSVPHSARAWESLLQKGLVSKGRPATLSMGLKNNLVAPSKAGWPLVPYFKRVHEVIDPSHLNFFKFSLKK